jgi:hypothetical protein
MSITFRLAAPLLAAGAAAAILGAPLAAASDNHLECTNVSGNSTTCETPGNVQLSSTPPPVSYPEEYPFLFDGPVFIHHGGGHR